MKKRNILKKSTPLALFLLMFLFSVPSVLMAGTITTYNYDLVTGTIDTDNSNSTAISAVVTIDKTGTSAPVGITFNNDNTYVLAGTIGGNYYSFSGKYTVGSYSPFGVTYEFFTDNGILVNNSRITFIFDENGAITAGGSAKLNVSGVPIPAAGWLLGSGLVSLVGLRRKFRK